VIHLICLCYIVLTACKHRYLQFASGIILYRDFPYSLRYLQFASCKSKEFQQNSCHCDTPAVRRLIGNEALFVPGEAGEETRLSNFIEIYCVILGESQWMSLVPEPFASVTNSVGDPRLINEDEAVLERERGVGLTKLVRARLPQFPRCVASTRTRGGGYTELVRRFFK
jgi:hypothetical protein